MSKVVFEKDFSRHPLHYFVLLCLQLIGLWGLFWFNYRPLTELVILIYMAISYVGWGIFHHYEHHDLHVKIVLEYLLIALMALLFFSVLLLRP